jgi:transposase
MTCWRRLRDWNDAGVFDQLHRLLLTKLRHADQLDWSRAVIDASHFRALKGAATGASPVDRGRPGSKHHLVCDAQGIPLWSA